MMTNQTIALLHDQTRKTTLQQWKRNTLSMLVTNLTITPTLALRRKVNFLNCLRNLMKSIRHLVENITTIISKLQFLLLLESKSADKSDKSLYVNSNTYRKSEKQRVSIVPKDNAENVNTSTFTKSTKPKRVESLIKRFEWNFLKRNKEPKEASPSPSAHSTDSQKKSKNIFNLISGNTKKTTRDIGIECKLDDERDYYNHNGMGTRKGSVQSISSDRKYRTVRIKDVRPDSEHRSRLGSMTTSVVKPMERRSKSRDYPYYENVKKSTPITPAPIRVDLRTNNKYYSDLTSESNRKPVGIASPQPQVRTRSSLRNGNPKIYENTKTPFTRSYAAPANRYNSDQEQSNSNNASKKDSSDRVSFREYREQQRMKNDSKRSNNNSEDELKKSYQQSFFIPV